MSADWRFFIDAIIFMHMQSATLCGEGDCYETCWGIVGYIGADIFICVFYRHAGFTADRFSESMVGYGPYRYLQLSHVARWALGN